MTTLIVIPARGGSKGVHRKNLQPVKGLPLIAYCIRNALAAKKADRVIVSTDDDEIAEVARSFGAEVPFKRPSHLAEDHISLIPVAQHAVKAMSEIHDFVADIIGTLQPTSPLLSAKSIDAGIDIMESTKSDSVSTVQRIVHDHPYQALKLLDDGKIDRLFPEGEFLLQKQDQPELYSRTGGLYLRRRAVLDGWSGKDFCLGADCRAVVVSTEEGLDIDTPLDLSMFRAIAENREAL